MLQACRLLAFFSAGASSAAERVAALAQHEGFLDASTIGRPATTKSTGKAVGIKRRSPSSGDVSPRTKSKQVILAIPVTATALTLHSTIP